MPKHFSRDRSPLSPVRYERTAGHSRNAKSPIGISKPYSSASYKELNSYGSGKSFDKYAAEKKYSKHDNGYKDLYDNKYSPSNWHPKDNYKMESSRKTDYKKSSTSRSKYDKVSYKETYKGPLGREKSTKYAKSDSKRPLSRERSPKYDKDYYQDDYKSLDKGSYSKKSDYKFKDYPSTTSKSDSRYKDDYFFKDLPSLSYKDSHKKDNYSSSDTFSHTTSKSYFAKPLDLIRSGGKSSYRDDYLDKKYDFLSPKKYGKCYDDDLSYSSKLSSRDFKKGLKDGGSRKRPSDHRRNDSSEQFSSLFLPEDDYLLQNNHSYERYVIGDSVVYGSPVHQPENLYSPPNRDSRYDNFPSLLSQERSTNNSRYSFTPPRFGRNDSFKRNSRLSPIRSIKQLPPLRSSDRSRSAFGNKRLLPPRRQSRDAYVGNQRTTTLKSLAPVSRRSRTADSIRNNGSRRGNLPTPLLSLRLPASSIPRASRIHINQTVSINDQALPISGERPRGTTGRRLDGRLGRAEGTYDRPARSSDLRLWIESRKNVNRKVAKIFPTKSKQSRPENLSAIANRVRLLEARKRALQNGSARRRLPVSRATDAARGVSSRDARPAARGRSKERASSRKRNGSKSPLRKIAKKDSPDRRRLRVPARSAAVKRTVSGRGKKLVKPATKSGGGRLVKSDAPRNGTLKAKRRPRSPVRAKRRDFITKRSSEKR